MNFLMYVRFLLFWITLAAQYSFAENSFSFVVKAQNDWDANGKQIPLVFKNTTPAEYGLFGNGTVVLLTRGADGNSIQGEMGFKSRGNRYTWEAEASLVYPDLVTALDRLSDIETIVVDANLGIEPKEVFFMAQRVYAKEIQRGGKLPKNRTITMPNLSFHDKDVMIHFLVDRLSQHPATSDLLPRTSGLQVILPPGKNCARLLSQVASDKTHAGPFKAAEVVISVEANGTSMRGMRLDP